MAVRKFKPTTPGQRHKIIGTFQRNLLYMESVLRVVVITLEK